MSHCSKRGFRAICRVFPLFLLIAFIISEPIVAAPVPAPANTVGYPGFDLRYGIPTGTNLADLVEKPRLIAMEVINFQDPTSGENRLNGFGEGHGVYRVPIAAMAEVLDNYLAQKSYSPRLLDVRVDLIEGNRTIIYQDIGIVFLGLKVGYRIRSEIFRDELSKGALGFRARLIESPDGNLFEAFSSWYLEEVEVGGELMTYARTFTRPGLRKPFLGMAAIVKNFTPGELKASLDITAKEARKRLARTR